MSWKKQKQYPRICLYYNVQLIDFIYAKMAKDHSGRLNKSSLMCIESFASNNEKGNEFQ